MSRCLKHAPSESAKGVFARLTMVKIDVDDDSAVLLVGQIP